MNIVTSLVATLALLLFFDGVYLGAMKGYFENQVIQVQSAKLSLRVAGAVPCYLLIAAGLYYFIIYKHRPLLDAFFLGIFVYGVYETTNYALLKQWKPMTVFIDTLWGGVLFTAITYIIYKMQKWWQ